MAGPTFIGLSANPIIGFVGPEGSTIPTVAGMEVGDLMIIYMIAHSPAAGGATDSDFGTNGGWTILPITVTGYGCDTQIWWKIATSTDTTTDHFQFQTDSGYNFTQMILWRGTDQTNPLGTILVDYADSGTTLTVEALSGLPAHSAIMLTGGQDEAYSGGFNINQITATPGSPFTLGYNVNGDSAPYSASAAMVYEEDVTSSSSTTFTQNNTGSTNDWITMAIPILAPASTPTGGPSGIAFDANGYIYVTNFETNTVLTFAPYATGSDAPLTTLTTDITDGGAPYGIGVIVPAGPPPPSPVFYPPCILADGTAGIPLEIQTPAKLLDEGRLALCSRFFIDINTNGEDLLLTILVDNSSYVYPIYLNTTGRETIEVDYQVSGRIYSINLVGCLSIGQIEFFEAWTDLDEGKEPVSGEQS